MSFKSKLLYTSLLLLILSTLSIQADRVGVVTPEVGDVVPKKSVSLDLNVLTAPINIVGDDTLANFTAVYGIPGAGTENNPYLFKDILLTGNGTNGFEISSTTKHMVFENVIFSGTFTFGFSFTNVVNVTFRDILFPDTVGTGIHHYDYSTYHSVDRNNNILVENVTFYSINGIATKYVDGITVVDSTFENPGNAIWLDEAGRFNVTGNSVLTGSTALSFTSGYTNTNYKEGTVKDNVIVTYDEGISMYYQDHKIIENNTVVSEAANGVALYYSADNIMRDNSLYGGQLWITMDAYSVYFQAVVTGNTLNDLPIMAAMDYNVHDPFSDVVYGQLILYKQNDLSFVLNTDSVDTPVRVKESSNITIHDSQFVRGQGSSSIWFHNSSSVTVRDSTFYRVGGMAMNFYNTQNVTVVRNEAIKTTGNVLNIQQGYRATVENNSFYGSAQGTLISVQNTNNTLIQGNMLYDSEYSHVSLYESHNSIIMKNSVLKGAGNGIYVSFSEDVTVANNSVKQVKIGVYLTYAKNAYVVYNDISETISSGIFISVADDTIIEENVIAYVDGIGLYISSTDIVKIILNHIMYTDTALSVESSSNVFVAETLLYSSSAYLTLDGVTNFTMVNCDFISEIGGPFVSFVSSSNLNFTNNYWSTWTAPDENVDGIVDKPYDIGFGVQDPEPSTFTFTLIPDPVEVTGADVRYEKGTNGHFAIWQVKNARSNSYSITKDGVTIVANKLLTSSTVSVNVDNLSEGVHVYIMSVTDFYTGSVSAVIIVEVYTNESGVVTTTETVTTTVTTSSGGNCTNVTMSTTVTSGTTITSYLSSTQNSSSAAKTSESGPELPVAMVVIFTSVTVAATARKKKRK